MTSSSGRPALVLATVLAMAAGCADFSRGGLVPGGGGAGGPSSGAGGTTGGAPLSFATDVNSILSGTCLRCHTAGGEAGDTTLILTGAAAADFAVVLPLIDTSAPATSRLLLKMSGNGHGGGTVYAVGAPQYQTVLLWIQQGALP